MMTLIKRYQICSQLEQVSNDIKNMAKMLDVPVLIVSSLSRANETRM
ncbi:DnaB-like helicase C-terminal domain-containing protein [Tissierella sp. MB52-C2]